MFNCQVEIGVSPTATTVDQAYSDLIGSATSVLHTTVSAAKFNVYCPLHTEVHMYIYRDTYATIYGSE